LIVTEFNSKDANYQTRYTQYWSCT